LIQAVTVRALVPNMPRNEVFMEGLELLPVASKYTATVVPGAGTGGTLVDSQTGKPAVPVPANTPVFVEPTLVE